MCRLNLLFIHHGRFQWANLFYREKNKWIWWSSVIFAACLAFRILDILNRQFLFNCSTMNCPIFGANYPWIQCHLHHPPQCAPAMLLRWALSLFSISSAQDVVPWWTVEALFKFLECQCQYQPVVLWFPLFGFGWHMLARKLGIWVPVW